MPSRTGSRPPARVAEGQVEVTRRRGHRVHRGPGRPAAHGVATVSGRRTGATAGYSARVGREQRVVRSPPARAAARARARSGSSPGSRRQVRAARRSRPRRGSPSRARRSRARPGRGRGSPVTSALTWFQTSLRAGPPQARIAVDLDAGREHRLATWRMASALASTIARARWPRPWASVRPANTRSRSGSQIGERSPARYGRKTRPSAPGGVAPASSRRRSVVDRRRRSPSRNQSSARPVAAIAAPTLYRPGSGAGVTKAPGTSTGRSQ